ncbi:alpha,alpha-trehalase TreA [Lysobacter auxotrophicus]|uniref:Alpha,alpha-trehalase TreA n=1 Tax=Lysobacter auxotrophicus TaxID=2992573 RepID=A0ABN6UGJ3_9GAMM|nr:alpha,alpha-trehalase TreA [Lysobacter auxotrophicus]BDU15270.1 alpha,alpha-trehalase TreA [Lysobacter auxotrophicus]
MNRRAPAFALHPALAALLLGSLCGCVPTAAQRENAPATTGVHAPDATPDLAYPALFAAVQHAELFDDQKTFADARPLRDPAGIDADFLEKRDAPGFDLMGFVQANFDIPAQVATAEVKVGRTLAAHIDGLWPRLTRTDPAPLPYDSRLPLRRSYVVPGGRFREMYYWDSYFTMLGLIESGERERARDMLANFAALIDEYGHIPNGARTYYLSRSQPPYFSHMVELEARTDGDDVYRRYLPQLRREYAFWMRGAERLAPGQASRRVVRLADGSVLNRYWDDRDTPRPEAWLHDVRTAASAPDRPAPDVFRELRAGAESGWDYSSRWLGDRKTLGTIRTTQYAPVDLNSLMHHLETTIALACRKAAQPDCAREFDDRAAKRAAALSMHLWNADGFYADYDIERRQVSAQVTAAALYPLFAGIASPQRAKLTALAVRAQLLQPGGLLTTTLRTGQQWDAPNAWAPLQWVAVEGLDRYGEAALAREIATNFLREVQRVFDARHKLVEKYDATGQAHGGGGEYPLQDGFGWTNGVVRALLVRYPEAQSQRAP